MPAPKRRLKKKIHNKLEMWFYTVMTQNTIKRQNESCQSYNNGQDIKEARHQKGSSILQKAKRTERLENIVAEDKFNGKLDTGQLHMTVLRDLIT